MFLACACWQTVREARNAGTPFTTCLGPFPIARFSLNRSCHRFIFTIGFKVRILGGSPDLCLNFPLHLMELSFRLTLLLCFIKFLLSETVKSGMARDPKLNREDSQLNP
jgi:hypothetical protein